MIAICEAMVAIDSGRDGRMPSRLATSAMTGRVEKAVRPVPAKIVMCIGNQRRQERNVFGIAAQDPFSQLDQIIQAAGYLHGGDGGDDRHNDQDNVDGYIARFESEYQCQNQHSQTAGKSDADTAQAGTQKYKD